ncbi:hypothetical protein SFMTTN_2029 [Sulfuriferula multivorans]|uniref:Uncharacterized protein n=1 Tax=Sulfuriferula multivorans TaxID=1559896 RepID=A0A401JF27_9PROT|nr:hypothetical protein [Sulfuriferula multivorans]GBL46216.1 hypothetical protein SFMTTN_2029 [Sulfuriferula multivorans]
MNRTLDNAVIWIMVALCLLPSLVVVPALLLVSRHAGPRSANILLAIDLLWNALSRGSPFQTISARAWYNRADPRWHRLVRVLDALQTDHCLNAYNAELARAARLLQPIENRK